jgi:SAM-dependent methyltransferase
MTATVEAPPTPRAVWAGPTGDAYHKKHTGLSLDRQWFWAKWRHDLAPASVLEVGCGTGANLSAFPQAVRAGVDVSGAALREVAARGRGLPCFGSASALPFANRTFDLVVTAGTLIHVPWEHLPGALWEVGRVAAKDVLLLEYDDSDSHVPPDQDKAGPSGVGQREIPWRGHRGVCWARPYGYLFWAARPDFALLARRQLGPADGWDRVTLAHFRRRDGR